MRLMKKWGFAATIAAIWAGPAGAQGEDQPPPNVVVAETQIVSLAPRLWAPATVVPAVDAEIPAEVSGRIIWTAERGAVVAAGDPIARIDDSRLQLALDEARAEVRRLQAQTGMLARDAERQQSLVDRGAGAESVRDRAEGDAAMARASLSRAQATAGRLALDVELAVVRAPFSGQVSERMLDVGEFAREGMPVARLIDIERKEVVARAPLASGRFLDIGDTAPLRGADGAVFEGVVNAVVEVGDARNRVVEIRVAAPNGRRWLSGEAASLATPTGPTRDVVAAPRDALVLREGGAYLFVLDDEDDVARRVAVDPGDGDGAYVEIDGAIEAGARVIVRGAERLRDGQAVKVLTGDT